MIEVVDITKEYDDVVALKGVSLELQKGEVMALVGPNGSGKSTLFRIFLGLLKPTKGTVLINGHEPSEQEWAEFKAKIGYMPERIVFYDNLTGEETLRLFAKVKGCDLESMREVITTILPEDVLKRKVGGYSKGMKQRLNFAQAIINDPEILFLDEPTSGLDPVGARQFYEILQQMRARKPLTVLLSTHILGQIEGRVDRIAILKNGHLLSCGRLEEFFRNLSLPVRLTLSVKEKDSQLESLIKQYGGSELTYKNGFLLAKVPYENKMALLKVLLQRLDRVEDLSFTEPSLEEVFFGLH